MNKYRASEIAAAINGKVTPEQIAIIESGLEPAVVIAGAGSGKTETMANRVLYLIANGAAKPEEILGLTFTRKAAAELRQRIRKRLRQLIAANILPAGFNIEVPVMTYHSYAGSLLTEYGLRIGIDGDVELVGDANLWQQANSLIRNWADEDFTYDSALTTLIDDVIGLTKNVLEHQVDLEKLKNSQLKVLKQLESMSPSKADETAIVKGAIKVLSQRIRILPIVEKFIEQRRTGGAIAFDDQMSLAAELAINLPQVGEIERAKFKLVLLDEYQDTSQSQVRMLSALFGNGHPVTAVGDPYQAVYGWRGAAIGTIKNFAQDFKGAKNEFNLSKTFRNDLAILNLANVLAEKVGAQINVSVPALTARDDAGDGLIKSEVFVDAESEAAAIAKHFAPIWNGATNAVLVRNRKQIPVIEAALHQAGLPVDVIGIGGLMSMPEIVDIFTLLKVIADPDAGAELMRHLTGPRINLGARDLAALGNFKRERAVLADKKLITQLATGELETAEADDLATGSLIEALDEIESADGAKFTNAGYARLIAFARDLRKLRSRAAGSLIDLIFEVEDYLHLNSELEYRDNGGAGRRHIDRFIEEAAKFGSNSLIEFLNWLEVAVKKERGLEAGAPDVKKNVIQLLTVHMAKGAEWDHVVLPGLVAGQFPSENSKNSISWLHAENEIPFEFRGDAREFPGIDFLTVKDCATAAARIEEFKNSCAELRLKEEWRLAYVAVTRAKHSLYATCAIWSEHKNPDHPSELMELIHNEVIEVPAKGTPNPVLAKKVIEIWPKESEIDYKQALATYESVTAQAMNKDAALLIKQRNIAPAQVKLPSRISVSTLVALKSDPESVLQTIRRPMPFLQDRFMRRGTQFHEWLEKHLKANTLFNDEDLDYQDNLESDTKLEDLKKRWLESEWADLTPFDLEVPFETVIAGTLVRGRIDAIYKNGENYEVVDWKTGSTKLGEAEAIQLAIYRMAWSKISGTPVEKIKAAFHYVPTGETDRRSDLLTEQQLIDLISPHR